MPAEMLKFMVFVPYGQLIQLKANLRSDLILGCHKWAREVDRSGSLGNDAESPLPLDTVGLEIAVIDREDGDQIFSSRQVDEGGIGEVHGAVRVAGHEG